MGVIDWTCVCVYGWGACHSRCIPPVTSKRSLARSRRTDWLDGRRRLGEDEIGAPFNSTVLCLSIDIHPSYVRRAMVMGDERGSTEGAFDASVWGHE